MVSPHASGPIFCADIAAGSRRTMFRGGTVRQGIGFKLTLGAYYLALGTWFGTTLMMGLAAANTFRVTRSLAPSLPPSDLPIDSPAEYLAGQVVNAAFSAMSM